jgi:hypothetical protein
LTWSKSFALIESEVSTIKARSNLNGQKTRIKHIHIVGNKGLKKDVGFLYFYLENGILNTGNGNYTSILLLDRECNFANQWITWSRFRHVGW